MGIVPASSQRSEAEDLGVWFVLCCPGTLDDKIDRIVLDHRKHCSESLVLGSIDRSSFESTLQVAVQCDRVIDRHLAAKIVQAIDDVAISSPGGSRPHGRVFRSGIDHGLTRRRCRIFPEIRRVIVKRRKEIFQAMACNFGTSEPRLRLWR